MREYNRVRACIHLDAISNNFDTMAKSLKVGTKMIGVIKADGYGHGAVPIAKEVEDKEYLWGFAVATIEEAIILRRNEVKKPILILGLVFEDAYEDLVTYDLRPAVFQEEMAEKLSKEAEKQGKTLSIHIKVDTGMGRIGMKDQKEGVEVIKKIKKLPGIEVEGVFTHFARADETDQSAVKKQLNRYETFVEMCKEEGIDFKIKHCSNSAGIMSLQEANKDIVRGGISIYGLYPSEDVNEKHMKLMPAMELKSHIVYIKEVEAGTAISYGGTYVAEGTRRIATIPVGYADGYPRGLSNKGWVLIDGKKAPITGRVCMDQFMVDVTGIENATAGMEVTLAGRDGEEVLSIETLGELSGRFNYELVCDITKRVPRIYDRNGEIIAVRHWFDE